MDSRLIILHSSPVIRRGISCFVKDIYDGESILLSNKAELRNLKNINGRLVIFFEDIPENEELSMYINHLKQQCSLNLISVCTGSPPDRHDLGMNKCLYLHDTKDSIRETIMSALQAVEPVFSGQSNKSENTLTTRETEVLKMVALGKTNKEIAHELFISIHTVISHRKNITDKLGIKSISGLTVYAIINHLIDTDAIDPEALI